VDFRLATVERHVTEERQHLDLFADRDPRVVAQLAIEVAERDVAEGADRREVCRAERLVARERGQRGDGLVALFENHGPRPLGPGV
jgi:hypothetical protein